MKDGFFIKVETYHKPGRGDEENVHELTPEQLKLREVIHIDITHDKVSPNDYKPDEDLWIPPLLCNPGSFPGKWNATSCLELSRQSFL